MNKGRQCPFAAIVQTHFDEALAADGRSVAVLESPRLTVPWVGGLLQCPFPAGGFFPTAILPFRQ
jgi:hypothetical protein